MNWVECKIHGIRREIKDYGKTYPPCPECLKTIKTMPLEYAFKSLIKSLKELLKEARDAG